MAIIPNPGSTEQAESTESEQSDIKLRPNSKQQPTKDRPDGRKRRKLKTSETIKAVERKAAADISIPEAFNKLPKKRQKYILARYQSELSRGLNTVAVDVVNQFFPSVSDLEKILFAGALVRLERKISKNFRDGFTRRQGPQYTLHQSPIPIAILYATLTYAEADEYAGYEWARTYAAAIRREIFSRMSQTTPQLAWFSDYSADAHKCTVYDIKGFRSFSYQTVRNNEKKSLIERRHALMTYFNSIHFTDFEESPAVGTKPLKGYHLAKGRKLPAVTKTALQRLASSQFRFENYLYSDAEDGFEYILAYCKLRQVAPDIEAAIFFAITYALEGLNPKLDIQYHGTYELCSTGRLYTRGGPQQLPKTLRRLFISPLDDDNISVEIDLKSAQLIILAEFLDCQGVLDWLLELRQRGESVWTHLQPKGYTLPKAILKIIVYGICFGAARESLPHLCNQDPHSTVSVTQRMVNEVLNGPIKPLVDKRDEWMKQFTPENVKKRRVPSRHTNALGLVMDLNKELTQLPARDQKPKSLTLAGQLLAFMAQGMEQLIMQSFIASDVLSEPILSQEFDGLTVEIPPGQLLETQAKYDAWLAAAFPNHQFEYTPLYFKQNLNFYEDGAELVRLMQEDWERFNHTDEYDAEETAEFIRMFMEAAVSPTVFD